MTQLLILNIILQLVDVATTIKGIKAGRSEKHPLLRGLINAIGLGPAMLLKTAAAVWFIYYFYQAASVGGLAGMAVVGVVVAYFNIKALKN